MSKDYYKILGVNKNANKDEIKKAFYKAASTHHPDKGGDVNKFKEANEAYQILSDDNKRKQYDTFGSASPGSSAGGGAGGFGGGFNGSGFDGFDFSGFQNGGGFGEGVEFDLGDIFGDFFGGGFGGRKKEKRGRDMEVQINISFEESVFGVEKIFTIDKDSKCKTCNGSGNKVGTKVKKCSTCDGAGKVRVLKRTIFGQIEQVAMCEACNGKGEKGEENCHTCKGHGVLNQREEIKVNIPAGINNGETMKVSGAGEAIINGKSGDLYVHISVKENKLWNRHGDNLITDYNIKLSDAVLGKKVYLNTLSGNLDLHIPQGTNSGDIIKINGKGIHSHTGRKGDLLIKINIDIPKKLSKKQEELIKELNKEGL